VNDYERIARVIRYLDERHIDQPDLSQLAAHVGLSEYHFHRLFSKWAGITPKDFLQCLTVAHAQELLRRGESVLGAATGAGLSGPGRLHDLCLNLEAATPGELKSGGQGWTIAAGFAGSPFGTCIVGEGPRGVCHIAFVESGGRAMAWSRLRMAWPGARVDRDDRAAARLARRIFEPRDRDLAGPALRAFVRGTVFQVRVWRALLSVRSGALTSYGRLAATLGQRSAARAVGTAVGANPLAYLIPCHRVIRETGLLGGYRWGTVRKRAMLAWESRSAHGGSPES